MNLEELPVYSVMESMSEEDKKLISQELHLQVSLIMKCSLHSQRIQKKGMNAEMLLMHSICMQIITVLTLLICSKQ